jgi:hypothetical protein
VPANLAVAVGTFPQVALVLGGVGDGKAGEESHDCLLVELKHWLD